MHEKKCMGKKRMGKIQTIKTKTGKITTEEYERMTCINVYEDGDLIATVWTHKKE